jgi:hypothetical protein
MGLIFHSNVQYLKQQRRTSETGFKPFFSEVCFRSIGKVLFANVNQTSLEEHHLHFFGRPITCQSINQCRKVNRTNSTKNDVTKHLVILEESNFMRGCQQMTSRYSRPGQRSAHRPHTAREAP